MIILTLIILGSTIPVTAYATAKTVYYKGTPVYWDYGRRWSVYSYSKVQSSVYQHSAIANSSFSGWKNPGIFAEASDFIGGGSAIAYWNCR